jgi:hypothetical protein
MFGKEIIKIKEERSIKILRKNIKKVNLEKVLYQSLDINYLHHYCPKNMKKITARQVTMSIFH